MPTVTYTTNTGSTSTLDISVTAVDDPSVLGADTNTVDEDHAATGNVLGNDHDVDNLLSVSSFSVNGVDGSFTAGQTATMTGVGTLIIASNGAYTFTPVENYNGTVPTVTYTTNTGSTSTLNISVTAVDDPSVLGADTQTVDEDHAATGNVLTNDHDVDNLLSVSSFSVNGVDGSFTAGQTATMTGVGTLIIASNGAYTFTPAENWNGTVPTVTYTTNTGSTSTLDISVTAVDDPSVLGADTNTVDEDHAATGNVLGNDHDVDNLLSVSSFSVNGVDGSFTAGQTATMTGVGTLIIASNGAYTFTPVENYNGTVPTVTYTTNTGSTSTLNISVTAVDDPSVLGADTQTVDEDHAATGNVLTNDHDVDNLLSVSSFSVNGVDGSFTAGQTATMTGVGTLIIASNGAYTFTPVENYNGTVPTVTYTTNTGSTSTLDISVTPVNDPSVLTADTNTVDEDHAATGNVLGNDSDVDNLLSVATFTVGGTEYTAGATPAIIANVGTLVIGASGAYTFTPVENWNGTVPTVTYTTNTGSTSTLDISVTPVNDPSVLTADTNTVDEDHAATGNVLTNDHDVDNDLSVATFTVGGTEYAAGATPAIIANVGTLVIGASGAYTFTPVENWNGTVPTVTYTTNTGSTSTLDISVTPVNDPSVLTADTNTVDEDHAATGNVLGNDSDVDNLLSVSSFSVNGVDGSFTAGQTATMTGVGTLIIASNGAYTFTPAENWNGTVPTVTYTTNTGSTSTLDISVTPVNDPSVLTADTNTVDEDHAATGNVLTNDHDVDNLLSVSSFSVNGVDGSFTAGQTATMTGVGTLIIASNGAYTFTPAENWNGTVPTVTYTTNTGSTSTLDISVTPVNDPSVLGADTNTVDEDHAATGNVLGNDHDVDNLLSVATFTVGGTEYTAGATPAIIANVGTLVIGANGAYTFTPVENWNGTVPTVTYTTNTGSTSTLNISVTPVNDPSVLTADTNTVDEDHTATGNVLGNDSDVDNDLSVATFTVGGTEYTAGVPAIIANVGTLVIGANGAYTFTPAENWNGTVPTVTYTTNTGSTSTLDISVTPVNDPSVLTADTNTVDEDHAATGNVLTNDHDVDNLLSVSSFSVNGVDGSFTAGQTATMTGVGTLIIASNGAYTFTPDSNYNGTVPTVTYTTNTGSTSTLDISVTPVNDPSVLTADTNTVDEDHAATGNVLTNDHDVDNLLSVATFTVGGTEYTAGATPAIIANVGTLVIGANGAYTFTPVENWNGTVPTVTYTTNTGSTSTLDISVTPVNDSSVLTADTQTVDEDQAATGNVLGNDSDVDNLLSVATFTVGGTEYAAGATPAIIANVGTLVIGASGAYTFTPVENWNGTVPTVTYTTNTGSTSTLDISVTPVNDPSVLTADTNTVDEDQAATGNVLGNDSDVDNLLSVATFTVGGTEYTAGVPAIIANVGTLVIGANGAYTFTPDSNYNGTVPTVTYTTNTGSTSTLDISVTPVNDPSVLTADTNTVDEDHAATGNVLGNDSDVDNLLSVSSFSVNGVDGSFTAGQTATMTGVGTLIIASNGAYTFTPVENYNGTVPTVTYTTNTGSTSTLDISVTPVNDPSVLTADTNTVDEDHAATGNVLGNDSDVDNLLSVATFTVGGTEYTAGVPAIIANVGTLVIGANGAYTFTPAENWNGTVPTVTYTTNTGSTSTLDISVTPVNDPSVLTADTNTVDEDHVATGNVLGNDSDVDNLLSVSSFSVNGVDGSFTAGQTATMTGVGTLIIASNGAYTFTPAENYNGTVPTVTYTTNTGSTSTLDISVTAVDDPSVLTADTQTVDEDHVATGNVLSNDSDVDNDLSVATFTVGGTEYAAGVPAIIANVGTLVIGANGAYAFTPVENWNGAVPQVTYTTNTGSTSTLDISVTPVNDPSVLTADTNTVDEDQAATGNVLGNDSDVDNLLSVATFTVGGTEYTAGATPAIIANVGSLTLGANGNYTFTPVENWNGTVPTVTYTTNTGSTSTLDISVTPVNDPSVLTADTNTVDEDHAATGNVLTNDHDVDNDLSVATFTVGGTEYTAGVPAIIANVGTLVIGANGAYTFTPAENWNGTVPTVTYTTNTGSTSTLDISVTPVNDPSVLTADTNTVDEDHAATGNVLTNDHDVDNDLSVATFTVGGTEYTAGVPAIIANVGTLVIGANGAYTFTPAENWNGTVPTVTYTTNTGSTSTLDISVTPVNDPSVLTADTNTVDEDQAATGNVLGNDSDVDNLLSVATFTVGGTEYTAGATPAIIANVGTLVIGASGAYTFTPDSNYNGTVPTVTYTTNTGSTSTLDISVTPVNDPSVLGADTNTVDEDHAATGNVLTNDHDVDNLLSVATFTVGGTEYAAGATPAIIANVGTLVIGANGAYTFTPDSNYNGTVPTVTYTTNTGSTSTLDISVTPVNDPSVLTADTNTVDEDHAATGNVLTNDHDVDNLLSVATFTVGGTEYAAGATPAIIANVGTLVIGASGAYTFTPVENWNGAVPQVTYTTNTGSTSTLDISVTPVNDSSVLTADTNTVDEDHAATGNVLTNDHDVDNLLSVSSFSVNGVDGSFTAGQTATMTGVGTLIIASNGAYTFTPAENWNGTVPTVTYTTNTGSTSTLNISVTPVNDPSVLTADTNTVLEDNIATGNVLTNDRDVDNVLSVAKFTVSGTEYTAGGTATIANVGTLTLGANGNYTFTPVENWNGTVPTVTYTTNTGSTSTLNISVTPVNEAPTAAPVNVTGTEDTSLILGWSTFGVSDVDSPATSLGVKITGLPVEGKLQYLNGSTWTDLTPNQTITKADIDAGKLRFMPDANESGANGYNSGTGNNLADYAQIQFQPTDGTLLGSTGTIKIDITPVADAPTLNVASNNVTSTGLIKEVWTGLAGLGTNGNGAPSDTLKSVIDAAGTPNSSSTVGNVQSSGDVAAGTASKTSGLIYLEAGKTYTFSGSGDDSLLVTIGGKNVASALWGNGGTLTGSFTPTTSGYYTLDIYHHNQSGPGSYDVNLSVNGGAAVDLSSAGVPLYTGVADLVASGVTVSDLHGTNGEGYYDGYKLNTGAEGTSVHLSAITTALTDVDGSESLSVKISGIPAGAVLTDGAGHTFTATATSGEANVTGWTLSSLTVTPPAYYNGQFNLTVTSTSTELLGGSAPPSVATIPVTVYPATYNPITATSGDDVRDGTSGNDIVVADIGGLTVTPGQNYNIAFMVDSSGSMSSSSVTSAKNSLITVFTSLIASATSPNSSAGTVKVFLVDFDSQVNKSISIDLSKPGALDLLKGVLNSMQSGGYTNYEDVFKTTANWFKGPDALSNLNATNLTYFITDGEPTAYTKDEQTNPLVVDYKSNSATDLYLDNVLKQGSYTPGTEFRMIIGGESRVVVDSSGALYKWTEKSNNNWTSDKYSANNSTLQVHAQGDGTYELSDYVVSGDVDSSASNAASAFALFAAANSKVQAIGVNGDVSENDLAPYNTTDGKPLANINPEDLANAILGHSEATLPGKDTINGGDGNDIIFGDLVSFTGVTGEGYTALQAFVGKETGVETNQVTPSNVHQYVTEHYSTLDVSGAHDGDDTLLGGAGNDIIFGQGGDDKLYGGSGNDILLGGTGNDLLNGEAGNDFLIGGAGTDTLDGGAGIDTLLGGTGNDTLIGGLGGDTFVWKAGDTGTDVIKDFNANEGDRIDLRDLLQNESGSTIDNFLKITTAGGVSSLEVNSAGNFNSADATAAKADVTIKLEGNNWSSANLHNLIAGSDPTIKVDHNNS
ncbi:Ig-like domain-containing protein [Pseudomonas sp. CLCA07]